MKKRIILTEHEKKILSEAGKIFAKFRVDRLTPEKRLEIARKASAAAAAARAKRRAEKEANVPPSTPKD